MHRDEGIFGQEVYCLSDISLHKQWICCVMHQQRVWGLLRDSMKWDWVANPGLENMRFG